MKTLSYRIEVSAEPSKVWAALTDSELYKRWASAFSPKSQFIGSWNQGATIDFYDPDFGGTRAVLEEVTVPERIRARHIATLDTDRNPDTESETSKKWIDSLESYRLSRSGDATVLEVEIVTHEELEEMFNESWAKALPLLKSVCEEA